MTFDGGDELTTLLLLHFVARMAAEYKLDLTRIGRIAQPTGQGCMARLMANVGAAGRPDRLIQNGLRTSSNIVFA